MSVRSSAALYTPEILALAVELAEYPLIGAGGQCGDAASRVCGSKVALELLMDADGAIERAGAQVTACAIGQAAAALFLRSARGRHTTDISEALTSLETWLSGASVHPHWPGVDQLAPARAHPARHAAILLPWKAALAALSKPVRAY